MRYCFDTSAYIEPWLRLYPPDVFPKVWTAVEDLVGNGLIVAPMDVRHELERQKDDLHAWAMSGPMAGMFMEADRGVMESFADIVNKHPDFMKVNSQKSGADPFVVAMAQTKGLAVVTYESMGKGTAPRIPNVCAARGIKCIQLMDVLRAEGVKF